MESLGKFTLPREEGKGKKMMGSDSGEKTVATLTC
jgi:hypothetical protein